MSTEGGGVFDRLRGYVGGDLSRAVDTPRNGVLILAGIVAAVILTLLNAEFYYHLAILICIFGIVATSLDVLSGYTGQVSVVHAGLMGIGAYTSAIVTMDYGLSVWVGMALAAVLVTVVGIVIGYLAFRTTGHYFVLTTLALAALITTVMTIWEPVTGGSGGIRGIIAPTHSLGVAGMTLVDFSTNQGYFYLSLALLVGTMVVINNILDSRIGRTMIAVRENEGLARSHGINAKTAKLTALGISCFFAGIAGSLYAHYFSFINPEVFGFFVGFEILVMTIIGGMGTIVGPILGASFIELVPELLREYPRLSELVYGIVLLLVVLYIPQGIWGVLRSLWD